uniref:Uncharacterized protein n=1 Tax=Anguilla anguilla TaxID=7936 RepID=A0A0E9TU90_ANGAN
MMGYTPRLA